MRMYGMDKSDVCYLLTIDTPKYVLSVLIDGNWKFVARASYEELMILTDNLHITWP